MPKLSSLRLRYADRERASPIALNAFGDAIIGVKSRFISAQMLGVLLGIVRPKAFPKSFQGMKRIWSLQSFAM